VPSNFKVYVSRHGDSGNLDGDVAATFVHKTRAVAYAEKRVTEMSPEWVDGDVSSVCVWSNKRDDLVFSYYYDRSGAFVKHERG